MMALAKGIVRRLGLLEATHHFERRIVTTYRDLRYRILGAPDGLPIPPRRLYALIVGADRLRIHDYFWIGKECAGGLNGLLRVQAPRLRTLEPILDFGCGCGRVVRHLWAADPRLNVWGTDINAEQVAWCRANLPFARVDVNGPRPPLAAPESTFGLAYAFSVFTHLSAELQGSWLRELVRVLRPGGYLLISLHGAAAAARLAPADRERFASGDLVVLNPELANDAERYGQCAAYHPPAYVNGELASDLELLAHIPGVADARRQIIWQDLYLFRKPASADSPPRL
jgi:SAM-dependent methyltransferase